MDLPTLNSILRVNGLTAQSAPANIADVLLRSGFKKEEIPAALAILSGAPPPTQIASRAAYAPIARSSRTPRFTYGRVSLFAGRVGVFQFWFAMLLAVFVYGLSFIAIEMSAVPLFALMSGISLFSPPDLSTASIQTLLLFGTGILMLILPGLFFLVVAMGLQVRRCHDYGLSSIVWFMAILALAVGGYLLYMLTPLGPIAGAVVAVLWLILVSWPGTSPENTYGVRAAYPSIWGALRGSANQGDGFFSFIRHYLVPLVYLEIIGIGFGLCVHTILPHMHAPNLPHSIEATQQGT